MRLTHKNIPVHPSLVLAWTIANLEACKSGSEVIEPIHFLLAALRIVDDNYAQDVNELNFDPEMLVQVEQHVAECRELLHRSDAEITALRRRLRKLVRESGPPRPAQRLSRSSTTHYLFQRAMRRVLKTGEEQLTLAHLLAELMINMPEEVLPLLEAEPVSGPTSDELD